LPGGRGKWRYREDHMGYAGLVAVVEKAFWSAIPLAITGCRKRKEEAEAVVSPQIKPFWNRAARTSGHPGGG